MEGGEGLDDIPKEHVGGRSTQPRHVLSNPSANVMGSAVV